MVKAGDWVTCILSPRPPSGVAVTVGKDYRVTKVISYGLSNCAIYFHDDRGSASYLSFDLFAEVVQTTKGFKAPPALLPFPTPPLHFVSRFSIGEIVRCVSLYISDFTIGRYYSVKNILSLYTIEVEDDCGVLQAVHDSSFESAYANDSFVQDTPSAAISSPQCQCGAKFTTWPDDHMSYCELAPPIKVTT